MDSSESHQPFIIRDLETLKVITDPLRNQILEAILAAPQTVKQIGEKLGLAPSKLYYHVNMLEEFGFIQVAETRLVANLLEKVYRASASDVEVDRSLISFATESGKQAINDSAVSMLDTTREDLLRSLQARSYQLSHGVPEHPRPGLLSREIRRIPEARLAEFQSRLQQLVADFCNLEAEAGPADAHPYALSIFFYPDYYYEMPPKDPA